MNAVTARLEEQASQIPKGERRAPSKQTCAPIVSISERAVSGQINQTRGFNGKQSYKKANQKGKTLMKNQPQLMQRQIYLPFRACPP